MENQEKDELEKRKKLYDDLCKQKDDSENREAYRQMRNSGSIPRHSIKPRGEIDQERMHVD